MEKIFFMTMAVATMALAGCSNDENEPTDNWNGEIRLSSGVTVQTRANNGDVPDKQIAEGQEVGVFINDAVETSEVISANLKYTADGSGSLTLADAGAQPYYPATGNGVKIIAYQPYDASAAIATSTTYDFTVKTDQNGSSNKDYYDSDLLYSSKTGAYERSKTAHALGFKHLLSKVACTLQTGTGTPDLTDATVEIVGAHLSGTFKPSDGTFSTKTSGDAPADIKMNSGITSGSYIAVLPPQTFAKDAQFLKVTLSSSAGGGVFYYKIPNGGSDTDLTLAEGKVYKYTITVNQTELGVSSSIEDWTGVSQPAKAGNAEME